MIKDVPGIIFQKSGSKRPPFSTKGQKNLSGTQQNVTQRLVKSLVCSKMFLEMFFPKLGSKASPFFLAFTEGLFRSFVKKRDLSDHKFGKRIFGNIYHEEDTLGNIFNPT